MTCRAFVQLTLDVDGIDDITDTKMLKNHYYLVSHLVDLDYGRKSDIGILKKERGYIFSQCCTESFKEKLLRYLNEVLFEMVKTAPKYTYIGGTTHIALKNEVTTFRKCIKTKRLGLWKIIH